MSEISPGIARPGTNVGRCQHCALFPLCFTQDLPDAERTAIERVIGREQPIGRNQHLFHAGQALKSIQVLRSGSVKSYQLSSDGDEIVSGFCLPGEVIGLDALSSTRQAGFAVALEHSRTCDIPIGEFASLLSKSPTLNRVVMGLLADEMAEARRLLLIVGHLDARTRIAVFLLNLSQRLARRRQNPDQFRLSMDRRDIANYLGVTIETVSRTLSGLQREGVIQVLGKRLRIADRPALQALAQAALPKVKDDPPAFRSAR